MANGNGSTSNGNGSSSKTISGVWWVDLIRREGVLLGIVVMYAYFIAIPESQLKQKALAATEAMTSKLTETVVSIDANVKLQQVSIDNQKASLARLETFSANVTDDHKTMLKSQTKALENHERMIVNEVKALESGTEQLRAMNKLLECAEKKRASPQPPIGTLSR